MALNPLLQKSLNASIRKILLQQTAAGSVAVQPSIIGRREVVGYGVNGQKIYFDRKDFPMPAIRFKEETPEIKVIREKEKGDWSKLTLEEKKLLYRFSYCQTFAEMNAPTGEWKKVLGLSFLAISFGISLFLLLKLYVYSDLPASFSEERQKAQLQRYIDLRVNPIEGLASKWDYEKNQWKE